jgi:hypothetical protein
MANNSNKDDLFEFYRKTLEEKQVFVERAWDTVKLHILLSSSLVSVAIGALVATHTSETFMKLLPVSRALVVMSLSLIPISMFAVLLLGKRNFRRECSRMYEHSGILIKLDERLGSEVKEDMDHLMRPLLRKKRTFQNVLKLKRELSPSLLWLN